MGISASKKTTKNTSYFTDNRQDNSITGAFDAQGQEVEGDFNNLSLTGAKGVSFNVLDKGAIGKSFDFATGVYNRALGAVRNSNHNAFAAYRDTANKTKDVFQDATKLVADSTNAAAASMSMTKMFLPAFALFALVSMWLAMRPKTRRVSK